MSVHCENMLTLQLTSLVMLPSMRAMLRDGDVEAVRLWLNAGVDANMVTSTMEGGGGGCTPLYIACQNGHAAMVGLLLGQGADREKANNNGFTPLYVACEKGHEKIARLLLGEGADKAKAMANNMYNVFAFAVALCGLTALLDGAFEGVRVSYDYYYTDSDLRWSLRGCTSII